MQELWIIIWRFQPFHIWHALLVEKAVAECDTILILIGSSNKIDADNPYSFEYRKSIIQEENLSAKIQIWQLPDFKDDKEWIEYILKYIPKTVKSCNIYCGDSKYDSAIQTLNEYKGMLFFDYQLIEIPRSIIPISATKIREYIHEWNKAQLRKYLSAKTLEKIIS